MENENIIYGRLLANVDIGGFCFERMVSQLKELLQEDKWKSINNGFKSKSDFIASLKLSSFKISIEQRKELAKLLVEDEGISQRATAKMIGISKDTIRRDTGANAPLEEEIKIDNEIIKNNIGANAPHTGMELVQKEQKKVDKSNFMTILNGECHLLTDDRCIEFDIVYNHGYIDFRQNRFYNFEQS